MSYDPSNLWSDAEDDAVRTFYPRHLGNWDGWAEVLPNRTQRAIMARARRLGVAGKRAPAGIARKRASPDQRHRDKPISHVPDPHEGYVMSCMAAGMTPSEIDRRMHWYNGTTRLILTNRWERENEQTD